MSTAPLQAEGWAAEAGRIARAQASSALATFVDWSLLTTLVAVNVHYLAAACFGALAGAVTDFSVKKWWVFDAQHGMLHAQALRYAAVSIASAGWNVLLAWAIVDLGGFRPHGSPVPGVILASLAIGFVWNYPLHRHFVFSPPSSDPAST
ncbi:MAG TPA: GtrA family protein [Anaeromyxobacteraceae bacterium]|jgi:putative flippase GtrA|nr:GtrA family protein [Anaeromyxobacteraceae bacterium]